MTNQIPVAPTNPVSSPGKNRTWIWVVVIAGVVLCLCAILVIVGLLLIPSIQLSTSEWLSSNPALYSGSPTPYLIGTKQYSSAPPMLIDTGKQYFATVKMAKGGEFVIQLYPDKAPITVNSFVFLARQGFYDGTTFHRVLEGFMAQGGDPTGRGAGGPGYQFVNEINDLEFDKAGVVAMANAGQNTNGSQFFIMFGPYGLAESDYTIFGQVVSGLDVVNGLTRRDPQQTPTFTGDVIESVTITER
jgi:cyclophilin family peptidyl-prolyl cis-trans isomerase